MRDEVKSLHVAYRAARATRSCSSPPSTTGGGWRPVAEALSHGADVVVPDLLGFGGSPAPLSSHYTLEDHVAAVLGTLRSSSATGRSRSWDRASGRSSPRTVRR